MTAEFAPDAADGAGVRVDLTQWAWVIDLYLDDLDDAARAATGGPRRPARRPGGHHERAARAARPTRCGPGCCPTASSTTRRRPLSSAGSPRPRCSQRKRADAAALRQAADATRRCVDAAGARSLLGALNDLRLMLGTRLGVTEEGVLDGGEDLQAYQLLRAVHLPAGAAGRRPGRRAGRARARADRPPSLDPCSSSTRTSSTRSWPMPARDHPDEACGVIAGPVGSDRPERFVPMVNAARSPTFYEFDSMDLLRLYREMDARDEEPVVIYHSHTATEAYPSRTDITLRVRAERPLPSGVDPRPGLRGDPVVSHRGRCRHRGRSEHRSDVER